MPRALPRPRARVTQVRTSISLTPMHYRYHYRTISLTSVHDVKMSVNASWNWPFRGHSIITPQFATITTFHSKSILVGPTVTRPVQDPLAVVLLDNRLYFKGENVYITRAVQSISTVSFLPFKYGSFSNYRKQKFFFIDKS